jgi:hypothetical protein
MNQGKSLTNGYEPQLEKCSGNKKRHGETVPLKAKKNYFFISIIMMGVS